MNGLAKQLLPRDINAQAQMFESVSALMHVFVSDFQNQCHHVNHPDTAAATFLTDFLLGRPVHNVLNFVTVQRSRLWVPKWLKSMDSVKLLLSLEPREIENSVLHKALTNLWGTNYAVEWFNKQGCRVRREGHMGQSAPSDPDRVWHVFANDEQALEEVPDGSLDCLFLTSSPRLHQETLDLYLAKLAPGALVIAHHIVRWFDCERQLYERLHRAPFGDARYHKAGWGVITATYTG